MTSMRICFLNHDMDPALGAGRFGVNLVERLARADPRLDAEVLITIASGHPRERAILPKTLSGFIVRCAEIRRAFSSADIIHALDGYPYGFIAALASLGLGKKLIITAIGTGAVRPLYGRMGWLLAWAYRRANRVVAISRNTKREILEKVPDCAIAVVNHAVDADDFRAHGDGELAPEERGAILALKPYILSVGAWKKRKGFEYSFPAFAEVQKKFPRLSYVVCGIGPKPHLEAPHGLGGRVKYFKGVRWPFLRSLYQNAELFMLLPVDDEKDIEGFGFAFLEAAAAGLPVIGTMASGAEDAGAEGENGYLVPPRNSAAAAAAATAILGNPGLRKKFSDGSLAFAKRMSWDRVVSAYRNMYGELLKS